MPSSRTLPACLTAGLLRALNTPMRTAMSPREASGRLTCTRPQSLFLPRSVELVAENSSGDRPSLHFSPALESSYVCPRLGNADRLVRSLLSTTTSPAQRPACSRPAHSCSGRCRRWRNGDTRTALWSRLPSLPLFTKLSSTPKVPQKGAPCQGPSRPRWPQDYSYYTLSPAYSSATLSSPALLLSRPHLPPARWDLEATSWNDPAFLRAPSTW